jgi:hypothetical protein
MNMDGQKETVWKRRERKTEMIVCVHSRLRRSLIK